MFFPFIRRYTFRDYLQYNAPASLWKSILRKFFSNKPVISWAMYDWANSAFATTVMAGFFPVFFKSYWATGMSATESTVRLGTANALASLLVVLLAPLLGVVADRSGHKKGLLLLFAMLGALMSAGLFLVAEGYWLVAAGMYVLGVIGFAGGNVTYDAMLVDVAQKGELERVSALGFALGYLGGGLLFAVNVLMVLYPENFGLSGKSEAVNIVPTYPIACEMSSDRKSTQPTATITNVTTRRIAIYFSDGMLRIPLSRSTTRNTPW